MVRHKKLAISSLNVKTHPHSPDTYVSLLKETFLLANSTKIRGADWGTIGSLHEISNGNPLDGFYGEFYRFLNIDPADPWFDQARRKVIEIDEDNPVLPVPEHMKPNLKKVLFVFYPRKHRLIIDADVFTTRGAQTLLNGIFADSQIVKKYGHVDVEVDSSHEAIERILAIPAITKVEIRISVPNADDTSDLEQRVINRLNRQNAKTVTETYTSDKHTGLTPDNETKILMKVARSNGYVNATGYDGEKKVFESTLSHPLKETSVYDPNTTTRKNAMIELSARVLSNIARL